MEEKKTFKDWLWDKTGLSFWTVWHEYLIHKRFNWITLNIIQLEIDWDKQCGEVSITIQLLGFGLMWQLRYKRLEDTKVGESLVEYLSSTKVNTKETALKVLGRLQSGEPLSSLILEYENMDTTIRI